MKNWLIKKKSGLFCEPGNFYIDPIRPVDSALITHAHTDHARPNNKKILATKETINIMKIRYQDNYCKTKQQIKYGEKININGVKVKFLPAGHIIGSAQILLEYKGEKVIISGDYKRRYDKTCQPFEINKCDTFITEATFALPVFNHPDDKIEVKKIIDSIKGNSDQIHLIGVYALGKCQRLICLLRDLGFDETIYLHGALIKISNYYETEEIDLGSLKNVTEIKDFKGGELVLCPPSALHDRWSQKFKNVIKGFVSGWMTIRQRIKQKNINLPIVISDHADWNELTDTVKEVSPENVLVTHGREEALLSFLKKKGYNCGSLNLLGFEDEDD